MPDMLAERPDLSITNRCAASANDQFDRSLSLPVIGGRHQNLGHVMPAAPGGTIDGLDLEEVGSRADIAEGGDVVAEGGLLAGHFKVLHDCEIILRQVGHRPTEATDQHQNVRRVGVAVRRRAGRSLR